MFHNLHSLRHALSQCSLTSKTFPLITGKERGASPFGGVGFLFFVMHTSLNVSPGIVKPGTFCIKKKGDTMELKVEYLDKKQLKPYANNAKTHPAEQVEQIKKSIRDFGFDDPIAVWGKNEVVEGHGRLLAVMEMDDIDKVPVIRLDHLSEEQKKAYALVHNQLTMNSGFDLDLLEMELEGLNMDMSDFGLDFSKLDGMEEEMRRPEPTYTPDGVQNTISQSDDPYLPERYDDSEIEEYTANQESYVVKHRIIITFLPEQEKELISILGLKCESFDKVVYDLEELKV